MKIEESRLNMDFRQKISESKHSDLIRTVLVALVIPSLIVLGGVGASNLMTPEEPVRVGYVEVETQCLGLDAGVCLGFEKRTHTTYNYDNYENPETGTENYYRKIESELMIQAYNTCNADMNGYDWTSEVSYKDKTAAEWRRNENIQLLPCEKTFYRNLNATR